MQKRYGWDLLDASSAQIRISGEELGQYTVRLERNLKPVRWVCRGTKGAISIRLIDDTGGSEGARAERFTFLDPVDAVPISTPDALAGFEIGGQDGLFTVRSGDHLDALVLNHVTGGLQDLITCPRPRPIAPGAISARAMLDALDLWSRARLAGNLVAVQRAYTVQCMQAWMIEALCGRTWAHAESRFAGRLDSDEAIDALKLAVQNNSFAAALKGRSNQIVTRFDGRKCFAEVAARYNICKNRDECDFALIWAHEPLRLLVICSNLDEMLKQAAGNPILLRGARLVALLNASPSGGTE